MINALKELNLPSDVNEKILAVFNTHGNQNTAQSSASGNVARTSQGMYLENYNPSIGRLQPLNGTDPTTPEARKQGLKHAIVSADQTYGFAPGVADEVLAFMLSGINFNSISPSSILNAIRVSAREAEQKFGLSENARSMIENLATAAIYAPESVGSLTQHLNDLEYDGADA